MNVHKKRGKIKVKQFIFLQTKRWKTGTIHFQTQRLDAQRVVESVPPTTFVLLLAGGWRCTDAMMILLIVWISLCLMNRATETAVSPSGESPGSAEITSSRSNASVIRMRQVCDIHLGIISRIVPGSRSQDHEASQNNLIRFFKRI
jgi:hypothetical protein